MKIFQSRAFLLALLFLLLNDFIFKYSCPNWITGKLSDFTGLFIFPLFWAALFPKYTKQIFYGTAIAFLIWKSPLIDGWIAAWNELGLLSINRVVDYSDYLAIVSIPLAYYYSVKLAYKTWKLEPIFIVFVASFAFMATSAERPQIMVLEYMPMVVFEIQRDSIPDAAPVGILSERSFKNQMVRYKGNKIDFLEYYWSHYHNPDKIHYLERGIRSYDEVEGTEVFVQGKYLITRLKGIGYYPTRKDIHNFRDQMDFEKDKQYAFEEFKEEHNGVDSVALLRENIVLIYDSLEASPCLKVLPENINRIDSLALTFNAFGYRYQVNLKNSLLDGPFAEYYPEGQLKQRGQYKEGILDGIWEQFDQQNNKIKTDRFDMGRLIAFSSGSDADTLISYDQKINRMFWYNVLCLIGLIIAAGYVHYRILKTWLRNDAVPLGKGFWHFIANFFLSIGSCVVLLFFGVISLMMWISIFDETPIFVNRYVPYSFIFFYLFVAFLFFWSTKKHYYVLWFLLGFICIYFILNEVYYLTELNGL